MKQQKLREMRIKYDQLQTKTCGAEEDGDHEQNRFTNLRIIADGYSLFPSDVCFPHVSVISLTM